MEKERRELNKTIETEDSIYNINAVTADKVNHTLTINKIGLNKEITPVDFNGIEDKEVSVVPAEGGRFEGPVRVGNNTEPSISDEAVLNYRDTIDRVFKEFKHYSTLYSWNKSAQESNKKFEPIISGSSPDSISLVQGLEGHLLSFAEENWYKKYLSVYLYLCTDTGNLYYGASPEQGNYQSPRRIANFADKSGSLVFTDGSDRDPYTAEILANLFTNIDEIINAITNNKTLESGTVLKALVAERLQHVEHKDGGYTAEEFLGLIDDVTTKLDTLLELNKSDTAKNATNATNLKSITNTYTADDLATKFSEIYTTIINAIATAKSYTDTLEDDLTDGTITVSKAISATSAASATSANSTTNDSDGKVINKNYYRCSSNSSYVNTSATKTIYITTSSTSSPTTAPVKGDIWIKY